MSAAMPAYVAEALSIARSIDADADTMGAGAWDCLLVGAAHAPAVIDALGARFDYEDPNEPPTAHTRIVVREGYPRP